MNRDLPNIIGFCGSSGSGKSVAAGIMVKSHGYTEMSFAAPIKEAIKIMFGLTDEHVYGDKRDEPILEGQPNITPRKLLQSLGTEWGQNMVLPELWVMLLEDKWDRILRYDPTSRLVIPDVRFDHQAQWIRGKGGIVLHVFELNAKFSVLPMATHSHASEHGINAGLIDASVRNNKIGLDSLEYEINHVLDELMGRLSLTRNAPPSSKSDTLHVKHAIVEWADSVFPDRTITNAIHKLVLEELPEFLVSQNDPMELADVGILLYDIAHLAGIDLEDAMRKKMEINKKRTWKIDSTTGLMNHTRKAGAKNDA